MSEQWDGRPPNAERDGWHWLGDDRNPQPVLWLAEFASWADGTMHSPQSVVGLGFRYLGPCLLPSEVAARLEAARREEREENAELAERIISPWSLAASDELAAAIRARGDA
jgi:hypothetical protein